MLAELPWVCFFLWTTRSLCDRIIKGHDATTLGCKRPMSSMSPTIVRRGDGEMFALGSPGGSRIPGVYCLLIFFVN